MSPRSDLYRPARSTFASSAIAPIPCAREVANRSRYKSGIVARERVSEILCDQLRIVAISGGIESRGLRHLLAPLAVICPLRYSGVRCHCFDFSNMVRPDDDSADLRVFRSMAQRRPFSCHPKRPIRDAEILSEETAAPRTGSRAESRVEKIYVDGFGNFHLSNGILLSDPCPYF
jgi:hypothetical protein